MIWRRGGRWRRGASIKLNDIALWALHFSLTGTRLQIEVCHLQNLVGRVLHGKQDCESAITNILCHSVQETSPSLFSWGSKSDVAPSLSSNARHKVTRRDYRGCRYKGSLALHESSDVGLLLLSLSSALVKPSHP